MLRGERGREKGGMNNDRVIKSGNWNWNDHVGNFRGKVNEGLYFCQWKMVLFEEIVYSRRSWIYLLSNQPVIQN